MTQILHPTLGSLVVTGCGHPSCDSLVVFTQAQYERYRATETTCLNGHSRVWRRSQDNAADQARRLEAQLTQERRLRFEAERRAADVERERVRLDREVVVEKRTTRRALKVSAHIVKEHERTEKKKKAPR